MTQRDYNGADRSFSSEGDEGTPVQCVVAYRVVW
jgi:hypothetical protein